MISRVPAGCVVEYESASQTGLFAWVTETVATELSSLPLALLEFSRLPPALWSTSRTWQPRDTPEGWCDCCVTKWDPHFYPARGERIKTGSPGWAQGVNMRRGAPAHRVPRPARLCSPTPGDPWAVQVGLLDQRPPVALPSLDTWLSGLRAGSQLPTGPFQSPETVH